MNQYYVQVAKVPTGANIKAMARTLGLLALTSREFEVEADFGTFSGAQVGARIRQTGAWRLPSTVGGSGGMFFAPDNSYAVQLTDGDTTFTQQVQNVERAIVQQGNFIAALAAKGVDLSDQLVSARVFNLKDDGPDTLVLWIGMASQSAQDGIYDTPFSTALGFVNFGTLQVSEAQPLAEPVLPAPAPTTTMATVTRVAQAAR